MTPSSTPSTTEAVPAHHTPSGRPRARALGIPLDGTPGPWNAITDVPGVEVGHVTLIEGEGVRTGVTALLPRGREGVGTPCAAGWYSLNGNGEMTGTTWIEESGGFNLPIALTNTHAVGAVHAGVDQWVAESRPRLAAQWMLPVVAETWDGYLNDINGRHVRPEHAVAALDAAASGPLEEGSVGGGTGMNCYGFKGGSGTSSRTVAYGPDTWTVGALVQANFGDRRELVVAGTPVGRSLPDDNPMEEDDWFRRDLGGAPGRVPGGAGSVIVVLGTDAPLLPGQCKALARRAALGLARTGTSGGHFSGDIFLAFSTANAGALNSTFPEGEPTGEDYDNLRFVPWGRIDPFYEATVQCVEEAVLNALVANASMTGRRGHRTPALPHDRVRALLGLA
ncbi:P1 family peptidase [Streptomyces sp. NPDC004284]|uniref:DmpA family aminopeptidase n=1 Tax=Streptomyces sp. NPDC004284 TaxID=3364695 RepID=UPI0036AC1F56